MALTPLSKGLIACVVIAGTGSLAWNFGLKDMLSGEAGPQADGSAAVAAASNSSWGSSDSEPDTPSAPVPSSGKGALGSKGNPLKVSLVSFHGYAPALVANGKSLKTQPGSIYSNLGVNVEFVIEDSIPTLATVFNSSAQCAWRTSDFWAQEQPNLRNAGGDGRAVLIVDNTQGGDAIISNDPNIRRVEDLAGKQLALLQFTPSDGMTIDAIANSSMTARQKQSVKMVYIQAEEGTAGVRAALESGSVDAVTLWDPDLALALKNVPGAHVVYSTKSATNLIFDVMVCDQRVLGNPDNQQVIQSFVDGWLQGVDASRKNPDAAVEALVKNEEMFALLAKTEGNGFIKSLFSNVVWTNLEDNARILGLAGGTNHYERVYKQFDEIYRTAGALANPNSPVIPPQQSFDYRYVKNLLAKNQAAVTEAAKPQFQFTETERTKVSEQAAAVTKPVTVNFTTGSASLTKKAMSTLDSELVPFIENNGSAYFEISGNTDSTGARDTNMRLSLARANAVVDYLVTQWELPRARFKVTGFGPDRPICNEGNAAGEGYSLDDCRALNRTTRAAVLSRE
ncbi:MAG: phosphate ABC transporter substrate-binding/OmpA family protein [Pseudomonadota bacterium]|nr:phosphate ABC transporter substrate-binding/OmpA family protein [Pseudomonadota bacterium]